MGKKIYIVTAGSYSDYGIIAVFEDMESAVDFIIDENSRDDMHVETYDIGVTENKSHRFPYRVKMYSNGDVDEVERLKEIADDFDPIRVINGGRDVHDLRPGHRALDGDTGCIRVNDKRTIKTYSYERVRESM